MLLGGSWQAFRDVCCRTSCSLFNATAAAELQVPSCSTSLCPVATHSQPPRGEPARDVAAACLDCSRMRAILLASDCTYLKCKTDQDFRFVARHSSGHLSPAGRTPSKDSEKLAWTWPFYLVSMATKHTERRGGVYQLPVCCQIQQVHTQKLLRQLPDSKTGHRMTDKHSHAWQSHVSHCVRTT